MQPLMKRMGFQDAIVEVFDLRMAVEMSLHACRYESTAPFHSS